MNHPTMALAPVNAIPWLPSGESLKALGFEFLDHTDKAVPYLRVVQPTTQSAGLADGSEARPGMFYNLALRTQSQELLFSILSVSKFFVTWTEGKEPQLIYLVLCADPALEPFVLKVSGTSIFNLKQLITSIERAEAQKSWEWQVRAVTERREGTKDGVPTKWYQIKFYLVERTRAEHVAALDHLHQLYTPQMALPDLDVPDLDSEEAPA